MNFTSAASLMSLLDEPKAELKIFALQQLNNIVDEFWHEISDVIEKLEILYEDKSFEQYKLAGLLVSKIYFHLGSFEDSMTYALNAEELFDLNSPTEYVKTILSKCIDCYTEQRRAVFDGKANAEPVNSKLESIINRLFRRCFKDGQYQDVLGLALDSRRLDILKYAITQSNKASDMLSYVSKFAINVIQNRTFRNQVLRLLVDLYFKLSNPDYMSMSRCLVFLDMPGAVTKILMKLIQGNEEKALISYQIAFDLFESGTQKFLVLVMKELLTCSKSPQVIGGLTTQDKKIEFAKKIQKIMDILLGKLTAYFHSQFLTRSNKSAMIVLNKSKKYLRKTVCYTGMIIANGFMHSGTTDDRFIKENYLWLEQMTNWTKTSAIASIGVIHRGQIQHSLKLMLGYLPNPVKSKYTKSGFLYALGLIHANQGGSMINVFVHQLRYVLTEEERHGACLGLGLTALGTQRRDVYEQLLDDLHRNEPCTGEAAGIAMGMVMLGSNNKIAIEQLITFAEESQHEKILRGLSVGIAFLMYGRLQDADTLIDRLAASENAIFRRSAMYVMAMAYCGTGNPTTIKKFLHVAVSDGDNDVRRVAMIGIGYILFKTPERCPNIVSLLTKSFNPHVRYGAAMALGICCAGTGMTEALDLLEHIIISDLVNFVRQGALIASAMILMQQNDETCPNIDFFRESYADAIEDRYDDEIVKFGALLAQGIIDAGGRNVTLSLQSRTGHTNMLAVVGTLVFTQYWYWFPLAHCLSMAFTPTCIIAINSDLRMPKLKFKSNAEPSWFDYSQSLEEKEKEKEVRKKIKVTILSMTKQKENKLTITDQTTDIDEEKIKAERIKMEAALKIVNQNSAFTMIHNPARVLKDQLYTMDMKNARRYVPVKDISIGGIIMVKDLKPSQEEDFVRYRGPFSMLYEEEPQPPQPFEWSED